MAHLPVVGHWRKRLVDFMELERQRSPLCPLGSGSEVRYYMGEKKAWYLGAMFKAGQFNYKLSETGKQGDLMGGGITAGYRLRLNKALDLDFNLGLGYLNADYEKYEVIDGVRVRRGNETKDWWGPIKAGVTLVWKLF